MSPFFRSCRSRVVEIIPPTTVVNISFTISTDSVVELIGIPRSVFLTEDHMIHLARNTRPVYPGHGSVD